MTHAISAAAPATTPNALAANAPALVAPNPDPPAAPSAPPAPQQPVAAPAPAIDWAAKLKDATQKGTEVKSAATRFETEYAAATTRLKQSLDSLDEALRGVDAATEKRDTSRAYLAASETRIAALTTLVDSATLDAQVAAAIDRVKKATSSGDAALLAAANAVLTGLTRKIPERDAARAAYQKAEGEIAAIVQSQDARNKKGELEKKLADANTKVAALTASWDKAGAELEQGKKAVADLHAQLQSVEGASNRC
jgi:chromosome segregation ATPase